MTKVIKGLIKATKSVTKATKATKGVTKATKVVTKGVIKARLPSALSSYVCDFQDYSFPTNQREEFVHTAKCKYP